MANLIDDAIFFKYHKGVTEFALSHVCFRFSLVALTLELALLRFRLEVVIQVVVLNTV